MSDWSYNPPYNTAQPGSPVRANGGAGYQAVGFRDVLDARRAMMGIRVPQAEYPDGYLGTIQSRREDRLLDNLKKRANDRSYQRGVHKGERIDQRDYFWPEEFGPTTGLEYEARGLKWTSKGGLPVEHLVNGGQYPFSSPEEMAAYYAQHGLAGHENATIDPLRLEKMRRLLPGWRG